MTSHFNTDYNQAIEFNNLLYIFLSIRKSNKKKMLHYSGPIFKWNMYITRIAEFGDTDLENFLAH